MTEEICVPILEKISGLKYNADFFAGYSPERINPGDKKHTVEKILMNFIDNYVVCKKCQYPEVKDKICKSCGHYNKKNKCS